MSDKILKWRIEYRHLCGMTTWYLPSDACCAGCGELFSRSAYEQVAREMDMTGWSMKYTGREKNHGILDTELTPSR